MKATTKRKPNQKLLNALTRLQLHCPEAILSMSHGGFSSTIALDNLICIYCNRAVGDRGFNEIRTAGLVEGIFPDRADDMWGLDRAKIANRHIIFKLVATMKEMGYVDKYLDKPYSEYT